MWKKAIFVSQIRIYLVIFEQWETMKDEYHDSLLKRSGRKMLYSWLFGVEPFWQIGYYKKKRKCVDGPLVARAEI